jgi:hypothetical protein
MTLVVSAKKLHVTRPKLTSTQKAARRQRQLALANDLDNAKQIITEDAQDIAEKHHRLN